MVSECGKSVAISIVIICDLIWSLTMVFGGFYLWLWKEQSGWMVVLGIFLGGAWSTKTMIRYINGNYEEEK